MKEKIQFTELDWEYDFPDEYTRYRQYQCVLCDKNFLSSERRKHCKVCFDPLQEQIEEKIKRIEQLKNLNLPQLLIDNEEEGLKELIKQYKNKNGSIYGMNS